MLHSFDATLRRLTGLEKGGKILLAVSGGVDSMTMANMALVSDTEPVLAVAHVNFSLRGEESDGDEAFVREWCSEKGIPFFSKRFDTASYASEKGISIEMAARELRYGWFDSLAEENGFDFVAVAHNLNDCVETMYLNLLRGTGIKGLSGIRERNGRVIRPMLSFSRDDIVSYAKKEGIQWREDCTNKENVYSRNKLRNVVFPEFIKINPSFLKTSLEEISRFSQVQAILDSLFEEKKKTLTSLGDAGSLIVDLRELKRGQNSPYWLYRILDEYGFNSAQTRQIEASLDGESGKRFFSRDYVAVRDRNTLRIYPLATSGTGIPVKFRTIPVTDGFDPRTAPTGVLYVDSAKVKGRLMVRRPSPGDRFHPLGMTGSRLLSDFFTDLKLDVERKGRESVVVVINDNGDEEIVAVAGRRIDDRYKVTSATKEVLEIYSSFSETS